MTADTGRSAAEASVVKTRDFITYLHNLKVEDIQQWRISSQTLAEPRFTDIFFVSCSFLLAVWHGEFDPDTHSEMSPVFTFTRSVSAAN